MRAHVAKIQTVGFRVPAPRARFGRIHEETRSGYLFLMPALLHLAVFVGFPVVYAFYLSFHDWNMTASSMRFVGTRNYAELVGDPTFIGALLNTVYFTAGVMVGIVVLSLGTALLLNQKIRRIGIFRTVAYFPAVTSVIVAGVLWTWLLDPQWGMVNYLVRLVGLPQPGWLGDPNWAMAGVILTAVWRNVGYFATIYLAALQGIDEQYYEAAKMDGANPIQLFQFITFPLLRPTTFFVLVMGIILSFQVFGIIYVMTGGGPVGSTTVIVFYLYQQAFIYFRMGYASAVAYVLFAVIFILTMLQVKFLGRYSEV